MMLRLGRTALLAVNDAARQSGLRRLGRAHGRFMVSACQSQAQKAATESEIRAFVTKLHTHMGVAVVGTAAALTLSMSPEIDAIAHARAAEVLPGPLPAPVSIDRKLPWHLFDEIGSGSFGTVRLGMSEETGQVAAIKIVEPDSRNYATLEREIAALKLIKALGGHRNIVDLQDVYVEGRRVYLVTELVRGGELYDHVVAYGAFDEYRASAVARDMCEALSFLHRHGLVHKDVKPENILMTSKAADKTGPSDAPIAKLIDFGSAGPATTVPSNLDDIGTSAYLSPELLQSGVCSTACDMWSLGCVLYIALSGAHPFDLEGTASDDEVEFRINHMPVTFDFGAWTNVSADAKDVITRLLHKDPTQRLTADQLLVHPWIISHIKPVDPVAYAATSPAVVSQIHV